MDGQSIRGAVNALDVHAAHPSLLATAGGDGSFIFWQKARIRRRLETALGGSQRNLRFSLGVQFFLLGFLGWVSIVHLTHKKLPTFSGGSDSPVL